MEIKDLYYLRKGTFHKVEKIGEDEIRFYNADGFFRFYHEQDCCESVYIESIEGDLSALENTPILVAEERIQSGELDHYDSYTWTFYHFATIKGYVDIRWNGSSNGYYSESVDVQFVPNNPEDSGDLIRY